MRPIDAGLGSVEVGSFSQRFNGCDAGRRQADQFRRNLAP